MDICLDTTYIAPQDRTQAELQQQIDWLSQLLVALIAALIGYICYNNGWLLCMKQVLHSFIFRVEPMHLVQADKPFPRKRRSYMKSAGFNFQTKHGYRKDKTTDDHSKAKTWRDDKMKECTSIGDQLNKREGLAHAIQTSYEDIVDGTQWKGGLFPDHLVQAGVISDVEYQQISAISTCEQNQIRTLLLMVLKRDYSTLLSFLWCLGLFHPNIRDSIEHSMTSSDQISQKCTRCLMKQRVNISRVADKLFSRCCISSELMSNISKLDFLPEPLNGFWDSLLCEVLHGENFQYRVKLIIEAVDQTGVHTDIVQLLHEECKVGTNCLKCKCGPQMEVLKDDNKHTNRDSGLSQFGDDIFSFQDSDD